jgi:CRISPR/Cas system-associated protein Cas7 (RAMP superfamily)
MKQFNGPAYDPEVDDERLTSQYERIFDLMKDGEWRTIREIAAALTKDAESSISAQLRHMRKAHFGSHNVDRMVTGKQGTGLYSYRLVVNTDGLGLTVDDRVRVRYETHRNTLAMLLESKRLESLTRKA